MTTPESTPVDPALVKRAAGHVADVLRVAFEHGAGARALVVSDAQCTLSRTLAAAYRVALPEAQHLDFDAAGPDAVMRAFEELVAGDLVVLVQTSSFRLDAFRIRVHLFKRGLKVLEHPHLGRMLPDELPLYVDSLAYEPAYFRGVGPALRALLDASARAEVHSGAGQPLVFQGGFESAKVNIGDYTGMPNTGGQFPIGEVFTEAVDLEQTHGEVRIFAFGDTSFHVSVPDVPITLVVEKGRVVGTRDSTPAFDVVLEQIRATEEVWVRELGLGLNRAFTRERRVVDVGTYERMCGVHLSLGAKHAIYPKPGLKRKEGRFHVDVFVETERVVLGGKDTWRDGAWQVT